MSLFNVSPICHYLQFSGNLSVTVAILVGQTSIATLRPLQLGLAFDGAAFTDVMRRREATRFRRDCCSVSPQICFITRGEFSYRQDVTVQTYRGLSRSRSEAPPPVCEPDAPASAGNQSANAQHRAPTREPGGGKQDKLKLTFLLVPSVPSCLSSGLVLWLLPWLACWVVFLPFGFVRACSLTLLLCVSGSGASVPSFRGVVSFFGHHARPYRYPLIASVIHWIAVKMDFDPENTMFF